MKINLYDPRIRRNVKVSAFGDEAKDIYKYQIETMKLNPTLVLRNSGLQYNTKTKKLKRVASKAKPPKGIQTIHYQQIQEKPQSALKKIFQGYKGKNISAYYEGPVGSFNFPQTLIPKATSDFNKLWDSNWFIWGYDENYAFGEKNIDIDAGAQGQLIITTNKKVKPQDLQQYFLDGPVHCFFQPIVDKISQKENLNPQDKSRINKILGKQLKKGFKEGYIHEYENGVPSDKETLQKLSDDLNCRFYIEIPSVRKKNIQIFDIQPQKKVGSVPSFHYVNTRINHVELNQYTSKSEQIYLPQEEFDNYVEELNNTNQFYLYQKNREDKISYIQSLKGEFRPQNNFKNILKFQNDNKINQFGINAKTDPELSEFVRTFVGINTSKDFTDTSLEEYPNHIDMSKSYARATSSQYYEGYLAKITDFRKTNQIETIGIYQINNLNFENCRYPIIQSMEIYHDYNAYPSPELQFLQDNGVEFDIIGGCWGTKCDFELDSEIMLEEEDDKANYKRFYGLQMMYSEDTTYNFKAETLEYAKLVSYHHKEDADIYYNKHTKEATMRLEKRQIYHRTHIATFIHSYARLNLFQQLFKFNPEQIGRVCVDGIFYKGEVELTDLYVSKPGCYNVELDTSRKYVDNVGIDFETGENLIYYQGKYRPFYQEELCIGGGGCGKTYHQLTDKGLVGVGYFPLPWKLLRNKQQEFNCEGDVWTGLTNDNDRNRLSENQKKYSTLIIDEVSMMDDRVKQLIQKNFPYHKIIYCGDLGYQLPPIPNKDEEGKNLPVIEFKPDNIKTTEYKKSYRCKCMVLQGLLDELRVLIERERRGEFKVKPWKGQVYNWRPVLKTPIYYENEDYLIDNYDYKTDIIICYTQCICSYFTKKFPDKPKYKIINNDNRISQNICNGDIVFDVSNLRDKSYEFRHGYTIHSVQGETAKGKLFIDLNNITTSRMLYTAVSRAQYFDNIVFIYGNPLRDYASEA